MFFVFHVRQMEVDNTIKSKGGFTFYAEGENNRLRWGVSKCHEIENYCKHTGRVKAEGRSKSKNFFFLTEMMDSRTAKYFVQIVSRYLESTKTNTPTKVVIDGSIGNAKMYKTQYDKKHHKIKEHV